MSSIKNRAVRCARKKRSRPIRTPCIRRGASNTNVLTIVIIVVVVGGLLIVGCLGAALGLLLPALAKAREAAGAVRSGSQLVQINTVYTIWQRDPNRTEPFTFQMLIDEQWANADLFQSPFGPVPDGGDDYWFLAQRPELDAEQMSRLIVGYDRAMYATRPIVAVVFGDARKDALEIADFDRLLRSPPNDGVDFNLPRRAP